MTHPYRRRGPTPKGVRRPSCQYCGEKALRVAGRKLFTPADPRHEKFKHDVFFCCKPCNAFVAAHRGTGRPMGELANKALRTARREAHAALDFFWRGRTGKRLTMYAWLASELNISVEQCHIGFFDEATCRRVVELCTGLRAGGTPV